MIMFNITFWVWFHANQQRIWKHVIPYCSPSTATVPASIKMFVYLSVNLIIFLNSLSVSESSESEVQPFLKYDQNGKSERDTIQLGKRNT